MLLISPLLKPYVSLIFKIHSAELVQSQLSQRGHREVTGFSKTSGCQACFALSIGKHIVNLTQVYTYQRKQFATLNCFYS